MSPVSKRSIRSGSGKMVLEAPLLAQFPWLAHGFSTRQGGVSDWLHSRRSAGSGTELNLGKASWDSDENVLENRRRLLSYLQAEDMKLVLQRQIHSDLIRVLDGAALPAPPPAGDGLMTGRPGLLLGVLVADCLPVLLVDARRRVVAGLHCGWRGTARHLAEKAVGRMRLDFGSDPQDLWAGIGPGIRECCYQVGEEVADEFHSQFPAAGQLLLTRPRRLSPVEKKYPWLLNSVRRGQTRANPPEIYLDLTAANRRQLLDAGIPARQIYSDAPCVCCHPELFFSYRRDGERTGRMMGLIGVRKQYGRIRPEFQDDGDVFR